MTDQTTTPEPFRFTDADGDYLHIGIPNSPTGGSPAVSFHTMAEPVHVPVEELEGLIAAVRSMAAGQSPAAQLPVSEARTRLLQALDASYCQALGHTPEGLLAAYEASRTQTVDQAALRDRIAAAVHPLLMDTLPEVIAAARAREAADVVLAVLPAPAELASLAVNAGRALQDEKRHYEIACRENTRLRAMVDEYGDGAGALTRKLKQVRDLHRETCPLVKGEVPSGFKCGMCELLDAPAAPLRRVADETAATETQAESCAHCGQPIRRVTGTLAAWWVHDPGGNTVCDWARAAASPRATPKRPPMDPVHILGIEADAEPAAGARQDGAQR